MDTIQIAIAERVAEQHRHHGKALFFYVWGALLAMTAIEVYLTYQNMQPKKMLTILMGLSLIKAALIMSYFMHLKFEKLSLVLWLVPALVFCICMMLILFFPDSSRLLRLRGH